MYSIVTHRIKKSLIALFVFVMTMQLFIGKTVSFVVPSFQDMQSGREDAVFEFDFTGGEQKFELVANYAYEIELWGAYGGDGGNDNNGSGGAGGYSYGLIFVEQDTEINIVVGGKGQDKVGNGVFKGGYNGGG
jgi:hypothetical protein